MGLGWGGLGEWSGCMHAVGRMGFCAPQALGQAPGRVGSAPLPGCDPYPPSGARTTGHRARPLPTHLVSVQMGGNNT